ncbi:MAG: Coenzyme F420 hydrogenase/dehydrogenase, beta subunit C-terminal domain [Desulfurobacteriaceae bacterium]
MLELNSRFLIGSYKKAVEIESRTGNNPLEELLSVMFDSNMIDGILSSRIEGEFSVPFLVVRGNRVEVPSLNRFFGSVALLKKAIQKYRLSRIAVVAPSCAIDGLNKTQYYGIGCNWVKTAVALKVGILCTGSLTGKALTAEVLHLTGKEKRIKRFFYDGGLFYQTEEGELIPVNLNVHHHYINAACRYCLNLSAKGTDITYFPLKEENRAVFIVRSERGWRVVASVQKERPELFRFRQLKKEDLEGIVSLLREKALLNIDDILERVELGLPVPKWNDNKLRKFYRIWNAVEDYNFEEEVF